MHQAKPWTKVLQTARAATKATVAKRTFWRIIKTILKTFKSRISSLGSLIVALVWTNISSIRVCPHIMASTVFNKQNLIKIRTFIIPNRSSNHINNRDIKKPHRTQKWDLKATTAWQLRQGITTPGAMAQQDLLACYKVFNSILPSRHRQQLSHLPNKLKTVKWVRILQSIQITGKCARRTLTAF